MRAVQSKNLDHAFDKAFPSSALPDHPLPAHIPATRYYGSKRGVLGWIHSILRNLDFSNVLDAFGGTASVSLLMMHMGKKVSYHDAFKFNTDVAYTLLSPQVSLQRSALQDLIAGAHPLSGTITKNFGGKFYTTDEDLWLDGFMHAIRTSKMTEDQQKVARYCLYQACLKKRPFNLFHRPNLALRTRPDVSRTFGNAATWERSFGSHMLQAFDDVVKKSCLGCVEAEILAAGDASDIPPGYDLVYIDPPYIGKPNRRDEGYWRRYHFLEGLATYEEWNDTIEPKSPIGAALEPERFKNWSDPVTFFERLSSLVERHRNSIVVLSYLDRSQPARSEIERVFSAVFETVSVYSRDHNHALRSGKQTELIFVGRP